MDMDQGGEVYDQEAEIKNEIQSKPLVGPIVGLQELEAEFTDSPVFLKKTRELRESKGFGRYRSIRRDGSCFYRALCIALFEDILEHKDMERAKEVHGLCSDSLKFCANAGMNESGVEMFHEIFLDLVGILTASLGEETKDSEGDPIEAVGSTEELIGKLCEQGTEQYFVQHPRFITSAQLRAFKEEYLPYLPTCGNDMETFVTKEVEPVGVEADSLQCTALSTYFKVPLRIAYLDLSDGEVAIHEMGPEPTSTRRPIHLLYRPGHYDILYKDA